MRKMLSRFMAGFICSVMMFTTFGSDLSAATKTLPLTDSDHHVHTACADEACLEEGLSESGLFSILGIDRLMNSGLDGSDIKIAIFDTGIQSNQVNIAGAVSFVEDTMISNDHGARMAETLAVIAPQADLYDVRILDDNGEGKYSDIARGIDWAIENDIQIIALSVEGFEESDILAEALEKAEANNILVIAAAGNQGSSEVAYPAAYPQVISVGALNASGEIASYSNYGDQVDVFAPGVGIGDSCEPGTSYSVQYIAGVAALLWSADATLSSAEIRNLITGSVSDGRLDAAGAYTNLTLGDFSADVSGNANTTGSDLDGTVYAAACSHSYVRISTTSPTCTAQGYQTYRCYKCGVTQKRNYVAAKGHNTYTVVVNPTCTSAGSSTLKCRACTYSNTYVTLPAMGHNYTVFVSTTPKTCAAQGYSTYKCSRCSSTIKTNYVAAGHDTYTVVVDPTCTSAGSSTLKCRACTYSNTYATIPALGHNYTVLVSTTPKTCTARGYSTYRCSRCAATQNRNYVAAGHDTYTVVVDPTCTSAGSSTLKCRACTYSNTYTTIPATGHNYTVFVSTTPKTCTKQGYTTYKCSRCSSKINKDYVEAAGHDTYTVVVDPTCTSAGSSTLKCRACTYSNTYTPIPATGHNYTVFVSTTPKTCTKQGYTTYKCSRCSSTINKDYVEAAGHDTYTVVVNPTCTSAGSSTLKCRACTYSNTYTPIPALGHGYGNWVITREATPEVNGLKESTCSRCGVKSAIEIKPVIISTTQLDFPNITDYGESPYIMLDYATDWQFSISSGAEEWLHCEFLGTAHFKMYADINYTTNTREGSVYIKTASGYQVYNIHQAAAPEIPVEVYQIELPCYNTFGYVPDEYIAIDKESILGITFSSGVEDWLFTGTYAYGITIGAEINYSPDVRKGTIYIETTNGSFVYNVCQKGAEKIQFASNNDQIDIENALRNCGKEEYLYGPGFSDVCKIPETTKYCVVNVYFDGPVMIKDYIIFRKTVNSPAVDYGAALGMIEVVSVSGYFKIDQYNSGTPIISVELAENNNDLINSSKIQIQTAALFPKIKAVTSTFTLLSILSGGNPAFSSLGTAFSLLEWSTENLGGAMGSDTIEISEYASSYFDNGDIKDNILRKIDVYTCSPLCKPGDTISLRCLVNPPSETDGLTRGGAKEIRYTFDFIIYGLRIAPDSGQLTYVQVGQFDVATKPSDAYDSVIYNRSENGTLLS